MKTRKFDYDVFNEGESVFSADSYTQEEAKIIADKEYEVSQGNYKISESYCAFRCMSGMEDGLNRGCYMYGLKKGARGSFKVLVVEKL